MALPSNPCGISVTDTLNSIRGAFEYSITNKSPQSSKNDVVAALISDMGFSLKEANDIANLYYAEYEQNLKKNPPKELSNMDKLLKKNAEDFLMFESNSPLLSDAEIDNIRNEYERANNFRKAGAFTKASEIESGVATTLLSKMRNEAKAKIFESFLYTKPLISVRFFTSSFTSNFMENIIRAATSAFGTKGGINLSAFKNIFGSRYGFLKGRDVLGGGMTAMDTVSTENNNNIQSARPETLRLGGLSNLYASISAFAKKGIDLPDTLGIVSGTDLHYRTLITNKKYDELRKQGLSKSDAKKQANAAADLEMKLLSDADARLVADQIFKDDGKVVDDKLRNSTEYKIAVEEIKRSKRDEETTQRAFLKSSEDYFKSKMTQSSELGAAYNGIFGLFARGMNAIKSELVKSAEGSSEKGNIKTSRIKTALGLQVFGFLNGASAFAEKSIESIPIYGIPKILALQLGSQNVSDNLKSEIGQKQRDIVARMGVGIALYGLMRGIKAIAEENCGNKDLKVPENKIYGKYRMTICGKQVMPFVIPAQFEALFGFYNWLFDTSLSEKKDNALNDSVGAITGLLSNARIGGEQPSSKFVNYLMEANKIGLAETNLPELLI